MLVAKFVCQEKALFPATDPVYDENHQYQGSKTLVGAKVRLTPVTEGDDPVFGKATPSGEIAMTILNEHAHPYVEPGATYRVTFEKIE